MVAWGGVRERKEGEQERANEWVWEPDGMDEVRESEVGRGGDVKLEQRSKTGPKRPPACGEYPTA